MFKKLFSHQSKESNPSNYIAVDESKKKRRRRRNPTGLIIAIFFMVGGVIAGQYIISNRKPQEAVKGADANSTKEFSKVDISRSFSFPAYDKNKKLSKNGLTYEIVSAEKTDQIVIKGKRATAVNNRAFLILNLKLHNEHDESLFINTRNFVRVQPMGTEDKLAPEIHNDTVEVQADSTKITRVGMPIDMTQNEFTLFVGEVDGDREEIPLQL